MHPDSEVKYKERLEHDIKGKMALVFGSEIEAYRFKDYTQDLWGRNPTPSYYFQFYLRSYHVKVQVHTVGNQFGIIWGKNLSSLRLRSPLESYSPEKLQEILEEVRAYLDQGLSYTDLIFLDPLTLDSRDVKIWEIQRLIREIFQDQASFSQKDCDFENDQLRSASILTQLEDYQASFTTQLKGQQFSLRLHAPKRPSLEENWSFLELPHDLTEHRLRGILEELKAYLEDGLKQYQTDSDSSPNDESSQRKIQQEEAVENPQETADRQRFLGLKKLLFLQVLMTLFLTIATLVVEFSMSDAGYQSWEMKISAGRTQVHSFVVLLPFAYMFLTLAPTVRRLASLLQQYPDWRSLPAKGGVTPRGGLQWSLVAALLMVVIGTIDVSSRSPQPKVDREEIHHLPNLIRDYSAEERRSIFSRVIEDLDLTDKSEETPASSAE